MRRSAQTADASILTMNFPGFVYRTLRNDGVAAEALLEGTGLPADAFDDPDFRCDRRRHRRFILNAMAASSDPHLGPRLAQRFDLHNLGLPYYAALSADRLSAALDVLQRYLGVNFPIVEMEIEAEARELVFQFRPLFPLADIAYFVLASQLVLCKRIVAALLNQPTIEMRAELSAPRPRGWRDFAPRMDFPILFGAAETIARFPAAIVDRPIATADPITHRRLVELCGIHAARIATSGNLKSDVADFLGDPESASATLQEAAAAFSMSERSFRRRLADSGTSYRALVNDVRELKARDLLLNSDQSIQSIAFALGFQEPSNFARSFKRWTGQSPKAFRESRGIGRK